MQHTQEQRIFIVITFYTIRSVRIVVLAFQHFPERNCVNGMVNWQNTKTYSSYNQNMNIFEKPISLEKVWPYMRLSGSLLIIVPIFYESSLNGNSHLELLIVIKKCFLFWSKKCVDEIDNLIIIDARWRPMH